MCVSLSPSLCFSDLLLRSPNNSFKQFGFNSAHLLEVHFCSCKDYLALPVDAVINFSRSELQLEREVERERDRSRSSERGASAAQEDDELRCCGGLCGLPARSGVIMAGRLDPTRRDPMFQGSRLGSLISIVYRCAKI